jgi:HD-GYP domain-containing protein (c-di-GMP phosphodiesterase class II)
MSGKPKATSSLRIVPATASVSAAVKSDALSEIPDWARTVALTLLHAVKERDPYTYGHCRRVARHASLLAGAAGLNRHDQQVIEYASMFHDLGKMGIPDSILLKPGRLTSEEEAVMRAHPTKSADIVAPLAGVGFFKQTLPGILHHHERIDGLGYPFGMKGEAIPLAARIILIADTFDAMTTTRPYRKGLAHEIAYKELATFSGRQFDPHLVKVFLQAHPKWGSLDEEITEEFVSTRFKRAA